MARTHEMQEHQSHGNQVGFGLGSWKVSPGQKGWAFPPLPQVLNQEFLFQVAFLVQGSRSPWVWPLAQPACFHKDSSLLTDVTP